MDMVVLIGLGLAASAVVRTWQEAEHWQILSQAAYANGNALQLFRRRGGHRHLRNSVFVALPHLNPKSNPMSANVEPTAKSAAQACGSVCSAARLPGRFISCRPMWSLSLAAWADSASEVTGISRSSPGWNWVSRFLP